MKATIRLDGGGGIVFSDGLHEVRISRRWVLALFKSIVWSRGGAGSWRVQDVESDWQDFDLSADPLVVIPLAPEATAHDTGEVTWEAT